MLRYNVLTTMLTRTIIRNEKTGRVLSPKQLRESGLKVIDQHQDSSVDVLVYEDGSVMYHSHIYGQKERRMVFDIRKTQKYTSSYNKEDKLDLSGLDAIIGITNYATERLIHNEEAVALKYTVPKENGDEMVSKSKEKAEKKEKKKPVKKRCNVPTEPSPDVLDIVIEKETIQEKKKLINKLRACMEELKPEQREVIKLYYYENYNENEISQKLECPRTTIASRRKKALKLLAEKLEN